MKTIKQNTKENKILNFILLAILCSVILFKLINFPIKISGNSMYPTYKNEEVYHSNIFFNRKCIDRNTVITFWNKQSHSIYVKRIVAVEGDTVEIKNGYLYVNGEKENCSFEKMNDAGLASQKITVSKNQYFVLGDNRNNSNDSRAIGLISSNQIISILNTQK